MVAISPDDQFPGCPVARAISLMQLIYTRFYIGAYPLRKTRGGNVHPANRPTVHRLVGEEVETLISRATVPLMSMTTCSYAKLDVCRIGALAINSRLGNG